MVQYSKRTFEYQVSNETSPNHGRFWFLEKTGKTTVQSFKNTLKDCIIVTVFFFSKNKKHSWLGSVSFETWHPKVRFEYWTIFEGYFLVEIFQKQFWTFDQSLIFNVFSYIFKIKDKKRTADRSYSLQQAGQLKTFHQMSQ